MLSMSCPVLCWSLVLGLVVVIPTILPSPAPLPNICDIEVRHGTSSSPYLPTFFSTLWGHAVVLGYYVTWQPPKAFLLPNLLTDICLPKTGCEEYVFFSTSCLHGGIWRAAAPCRTSGGGNILAPPQCSPSAGVSTVSPHCCRVHLCWAWGSDLRLEAVRWHLVGWHFLRTLKVLSSENYGRSKLVPIDRCCSSVRALDILF